MTKRSVTERSLITSSPLQTRQLAGNLAALAQLPGVVALTGPLGAGKTQFVKGLGTGLEIDPDEICSATFVIICEYVGRCSLIHLDAYRLSGTDELDALGWDELLSRRDCLVTVEWADRVVASLPDDCLWVRFAISSPTERTITLTTSSSSPWCDAIGALKCQEDHSANKR